MEQQEAIKNIKVTVKNAYSYLQDSDIDLMFDIALADYIRLKYPFNKNPKKSAEIVYDFTISQWLVARIIDILGRAGGISVTAYKENNLNLTYGASYIDPNLVLQITPMAGV